MWELFMFSIIQLDGLYKTMYKYKIKQNYFSLSI